MHIIKLPYPVSPGLYLATNIQDGKRYPVMIYGQATREEYIAYTQSIDQSPPARPSPSWDHFYHASVD